MTQERMLDPMCGNRGINGELAPEHKTYLNVVE